MLNAGIRIITSSPGGIGRRERFILAVALGAGLGVTLVPGWTQNNLWPVTDSMSSGLKSFRDAVIITLSTGYRRAPAADSPCSPSEIRKLPAVSRSICIAAASLWWTLSDFIQHTLRDCRCAKTDCSCVSSLAYHRKIFIVSQFIISTCDCAAWVSFWR